MVFPLLNGFNCRIEQNKVAPLFKISFYQLSITCHSMPSAQRLYHSIQFHLNRLVTICQLIVFFSFFRNMQVLHTTDLLKCCLSSIMDEYHPLAVHLQTHHPSLNPSIRSSIHPFIYPSFTITICNYLEEFTE